MRCVPDLVLSDLGDGITVQELMLFAYQCEASGKRIAICECVASVEQQRALSRVIVALYALHAGTHVIRCSIKSHGSVTSTVIGYSTGKQLTSKQVDHRFVEQKRAGVLFGVLCVVQCLMTGPPSGGPRSE